MRVPQPLAEKIRALSEKENLVQWQVIEKALSFYETLKKNPAKKADLSQLDKVSWYIVKLSYSVSKLKDDPSEENMQWLEKMVQQVKERLGVDVSYLLQAAKTYAKTRSKEDLIELNMSWKMAVADLISMLFQ